MSFEYTIEKIGKDIKICCGNDHTFGTDAIILFDFAGVRKKDKVLDIGTGCGIIGVLAAEKTDAQVFGIDIQEKAIEQAKISASLSHLENRFIPVLKDIKETDGSFYPDGFTLILCNPPYFKPDDGKISENEAHAIARQEVKCTIEDIVESSYKVLCDKGRLCLCHKPERLIDVVSVMRKFKIEPKRLQFVKKSREAEPWLILIEGRKNGGAGLKVLPDLIITAGLEQTDTYNRYHNEVKKNEG
ncbi:MAG: methyltransferase domain-containing protein [Oscillospiraceae bacterium]|nr:methyltransferase domain-containing protein [Oscillospiraceae bacterium]